MVVPSPASRNFGSSPDLGRGRIIPNSLFPISVTGATYRNFAAYDPNLSNFDVPALNSPAVSPPLNVDGFSHFPIFIYDNSDFRPPGTKLPGALPLQADDAGCVGQWPDDLDIFLGRLVKRTSAEQC
jgi:hypothetical protein